MHVPDMAFSKHDVPVYQCGTIPGAQRFCAGHTSFFVDCRCCSSCWMQSAHTQSSSGISEKRRLEAIDVVAPVCRVLECFLLPAQYLLLEYFLLECFQTPKNTFCWNALTLKSASRRLQWAVFCFCGKSIFGRGRQRRQCRPCCSGLGYWLQALSLGPMA